MPKLSVWMVRSSLVCMGVGFLFGSLILHHKGIPIYLWSWRLLPPHIELMIFGWTVQLAMGVGFWILPRFPRGDRYGNTPLAWIAFVLFDVGMLTSAWAGFAAVDVVQAAGRGVMLVAVVLYLWVMTPRIRAFGAFANATTNPGEAHSASGTFDSNS